MENNINIENTNNINNNTNNNNNKYNNSNYKNNNNSIKKIHVKVIFKIIQVKTMLIIIVVIV